MGDLWLRCLGLGGLLSPGHLGACLGRREVFERREYDVVAHALNEAFMDGDRNHPVPYANEVDLQ